jgi:hypothetical protein
MQRATPDDLVRADRILLGLHQPEPDDNGDVENSGIGLLRNLITQGGMTRRE